jgi:putative FmdB family regulatory protein
MQLSKSWSFACATKVAYLICHLLYDKANLKRRRNMPIYEYECEKCGDKFEYFLRWGGDEKNVKCPKCGSENPKRVISSVAHKSSGSSCGTHSYG